MNITYRGIYFIILLTLIWLGGSLVVAFLPSSYLLNIIKNLHVLIPIFMPVLGAIAYIWKQVSQVRDYKNLSSRERQRLSSSMNSIQVSLITTVFCFVFALVSAAIIHYVVPIEKAVIPTILFLGFAFVCAFLMLALLTQFLEIEEFKRAMEDRDTKINARLEALRKLENK